MPHVAFFLTDAPARSAAAATLDPAVAPELEALDAGAKVFAREHSRVDLDGERYVYADEHFQTPLGYVDAELLSSTPPAPPAPPAKVEVVEEEVVTTTTTKTVVLRLTEEEAQTLQALLGWHVGGYGEDRDRVNAIYWALDAAGISSGTFLGTGSVSLGAQA